MIFRKESIDTKTVLHENPVMKNVTITVDEDVARWAKIHAAEHNTSLSRMLGETLREKMEQEKGYEKARRRFFQRKPTVLSEKGVSYPSRSDLYGR